MTTQEQAMVIRGLARYAARQGIPAGRAYREACRMQSCVIGNWAQFVQAYDDEIKAMAD